MPESEKVFVFLQGPHGPFFHRLAHMLRCAGAQVWRIGFNAGDRAFWFDRASYAPFDAPGDAWPDWFEHFIAEKGATDLVLYGDTRPIHARAVEIARDKGLTIHVFEEGYLRPYWVTYERGGANGHSRLMDMQVDDMRAALAQSDMLTHVPPAKWGQMRHHMFYGALYHWFVLFRNRDYKHFRPHRALPVSREFMLYLKRLGLIPLHALQRHTASRAIRRGGFPFHLALLQLEHDSALQEHSPFGSMTEFLEVVIDGFAKGAPKHHHLVIKAHPLEDGRAPLRMTARALARKYGLADRVHFVRGGKLATLLNQARTAVTVNSTAGQQALWRGIPLKAFGRAVYAKPEFVSSQPMQAFFAAPNRPDAVAYRDFRRFLLETSQVQGGFYSAAGRRQLLRQVTDMMLSDEDPYDAFLSGKAAPRQQLRLVN